MHLTNYHFYNTKNYLYSKPVKGLGGCEVCYGFAFNGKERDNETYGEGNAYDFGARIYDPRLGRWLSVDPLQAKYPGFSPFVFVLNMPLSAYDPDGRDVIILANTAGAGGVGHQAVLIKLATAGWVYISKDGAAQSGGIAGPSRYTIKAFKTLDEFKNSSHNFEVIDGTNHSKVGGGEESNMTFKLDENGNKIQRYDQAYYIQTNNEKEGIALNECLKIAKQDYVLTVSDCSDIPTTALNILEDTEGNKLTNGENGTTGFNKTNFSCELPNLKQATLEKRNQGTDYDFRVKPTDTKLKKNEKGKKEVKKVE
jgi:RHS repeat-associated protein